MTSRSFSEMGNEGVDAFIPMLDLLNHVRVGKEERGSSKREGKVVMKIAQSSEEGPVFDTKDT